jgi:hypothetical protein
MTYQVEQHKQSGSKVKVIQRTYGAASSWLLGMCFALLLLMAPSSQAQISICDDKSTQDVYSYHLEKMETSPQHSAQWGISYHYLNDAKKIHV